MPRAQLRALQVSWERFMQSRPSTRAARIAALAAAGLASALYAQTVNLRPGLYELTNTSDMQLPPEVAAKMPPQYRSMLQKPLVTQRCISQSDLDHVTEQLVEGKSRQENCSMPIRSVSGNQVKFTVQCPHSTSQFQGTFASESFQGTMVSTAEGHSVTAKMTARRIGDCK
jgi:hypothetical protein